YDGTNWEIFNTSNSQIPSNQINDLKVDKNNNVWICTANGGLAKLSDDMGWTIYNTTNSLLPVNDINTIEFDDYNNKWVGTKNGLLLLDADNNWYIFNSQNTPLTNNDILSIAIENINGTYIKWIGTANSLFRYDDWNMEWIRYNTSNSVITGNTINNIHIDNRRNKWLAVYNKNTNTGGGLIKIDSLNVWSIYTTENSNIPSNYVYDIDSDPNESNYPVWIATDNGIAKLTGSTWTLYNTNNTQGQLESNSIFSVKIQDNFKWIGTDKKLISLSGNNWNSYSFLNSGLPNNKINTIVSKRVNDNYVRWIGTSVGLTCFDGVNWTVFNVANSALPSNNISSLTLDDFGKLWVGTKPYQNLGGGLAKYDIEEDFWIVYNTINSELSSNTITALKTDKFHNIWVGTEGGGLIKISNQDEWQNYNESNSQIPSNVVKDINIDNNDVLWVATDYGLCTYNPITDRWEIFNKYNTPLPDNDIKKINFSPDFKTAWIASDAGLVKKQNNTWVVYNISNSELPTNIINDVKQDSSGFVWIATASGVVKTDEFSWQNYNSSNSNLTDNNVKLVLLEYVSKNKTKKLFATVNQGLFIFNSGNASLEKGLYLNVIQHPYIAELIHINAFTNRVIADTVNMSINNKSVELEQINQQQWYYREELQESEMLNIKFKALIDGLDYTINKNLSVNILNVNNNVARSYDNLICLKSELINEQNIIIEDIGNDTYEIKYAKSNENIYRIFTKDQNVLVLEKDNWVEYNTKQLKFHTFVNPTKIRLIDNNISKPVFQVSNYPNPFNPNTNIYLDLGQLDTREKINIVIYNVKGQVVRNLFNGLPDENKMVIQWDGKNNKGIELSTGIYFYRVDYNGKTQYNKMLLLK
ncbi:MAG: two-component regulator propeller domain-containing protein, partial [Candidatus Cloacimonadales bacterium]|nr:two-component regulator propeller domain-containing protein [Candidatus Cloacimonadales bacterium]